jgi:hypothetical protein
VPVAHQHLFTIANELNMRAEMRFQFGDIDRSHGAITPNMTILVIFYFRRRHLQTPSGPKRNNPRTEGGGALTKLWRRMRVFLFVPVVPVSTNISSFE